MIRHVAVFKWKPGFPDKDLNEWKNRLRALPEHIEELSSLTVGTDVLHGGRSWDAAVVADVDEVPSGLRWRVSRSWVRPPCPLPLPPRPAANGS